MEVITESDTIGVIANHAWSRQFVVIGYASGGFSHIPYRFFRMWNDAEEPNFGTLQIGRCSGFGVGSLVVYDTVAQSLRVGRFVSGGLRLQFLLNGQHELRTISTYMFSIAGVGLRSADPPQYGDSIIKNDVWMGDDVMMLGGGVIENGCIIGARSRLSPNFRSEPYGIYAGFPARLVSFRFAERVREALLDLAWWDMPLTWIRDNNNSFLVDLTVDEIQSLELLAALKERRVRASSVVPAPVAGELGQKTCS